MRRIGAELIIALTLSAGACGGERPAAEPPQFTTVEGEPIDVPVLQSVRETSPDQRVARMDVHVMLPTTVDLGTARATLQHIIDSLATADSVVAGIRVAGYVLGRYDPLTGEADLTPAIIGVWAPVDTAGFTERTARTRFRTAYQVLQPLPEKTGTDR